jgi:parallel beta-helix repeat protein
MKRHLLIGLLLMLSASVPFHSLSQSGLFVVPDHFLSIQAAIDASREGGLVIVKEGSYSETLVITKSLTLRAEGKATLAGYGDRPGILIEKAQDVRVEGLELRYNRIGVEIRSSTGITLTRMTIEPTAPHIPYGAILVRDSQVRVEESTIVGGDAGINLLGDSKADILGNAVTKGVIAGIFVRDQSSASIVENIVSQNLLAGIALSDKGIAYIKQNSIGSNEMDGVAVFAEASATITESIIQGNGGCGVWAEAGAEVRGWNNKLFQNNQDLCGAASGL